MTLPRFYPVLDTEALARNRLTLVPAARAMLDAGVRILQLRHKHHYGRGIFFACEEIARLCQDTGALFVVNDRADIARLVGAALHLGQDDLAPTCAREIVGTQKPIGFSTHNEGQLRAAASEPVDYVALGPIFRTESKQNPDPVVGTDRLRQLRPLTSQPLVAIGGINRSNARSVFAAGADSVAVVGDLLGDVSDVTRLGKRIEEWLRLTSN